MSNYKKGWRTDMVHIGTAMFCQIGSDVCVNFEVNKHFEEFSEVAQVQVLMNVKKQNYNLPF